MKNAVLMITDLVNEGRTITEIHSELSSANLTIPQTLFYSNALLSVADSICNSKGIEKITGLENMTPLICEQTENKGLLALITAIEKTCITSSQVRSLLESVTMQDSQICPASKTSVVAIENTSMDDSKILPGQLSKIQVPVSQYQSDDDKFETVSSKSVDSQVYVILIREYSCRGINTFLKHMV